MSPKTCPIGFNLGLTLGFSECDTKRATHFPEMAKGLKYLSRVVRKPLFCLGEKGADQLRSNCEADQHLCFCYTDSTIPLLSKYKISTL